MVGSMGVALQFLLDENIWLRGSGDERFLLIVCGGAESNSYSHRFV